MKRLYDSEAEPIIALRYGIPLSDSHRFPIIIATRTLLVMHSVRNFELRISRTTLLSVTKEVL